MKCEEEEGLDDQQVCNQERNSSLDQDDSEPPQIKEEPEELCISQEGEQLVVKQEAEGIIVWTDEERLKQLNNIWKPEIDLHTTECHQQHICKEEEVLAHQERNSSLDQEDPEPPQIKEEQEELCTSQEVVQIVLKQETDTFTVTPTYEESDLNEPNSDHFLALSFPEPESVDQGESVHVDSGSTRNAELKKRRHPSNGVKNSPVSESRCKIDTSKKSIKCETCGKTFQCRSSLMRHVRVHTSEKPHSCGTCGKRFIWKSGLETHVRIHTGEKPYFCNTCGKRFNKKSGFESHVRIHTGEKPYFCGTCGKSFGKKSGLETHLRIHTGEKPYSCNICRKEFRDLSTMKSHRRIHTGEKPYACRCCGERFSWKSGLNFHLRIHAGEEPKHYNS